MSATFVYSDDISLAAELIGLASSLGSEVSVIALDTQAAEGLASVGATTVEFLEGASSLPENNSKAIASLLRDRNASLFLVGATPCGRDLAAQVAGFMDCAMVSDIAEISNIGGRITTKRIIFGGAVVAEVSGVGFTVATVPAGLHDPTEGNAQIVTTTIAVDERLKCISSAQIGSQGINVADAERVVSVGMGLDSESDLKLILDLASALDAGIACSRGIAEEREWLPQNQYVGISGLHIKPRIYLAVGISGQVQHMVGVRDAKIIVAINKDPNAPIFDSCDYGIVGDLYQVIPSLIKELTS